jgi:hypothetical protein
VLGDQAFVEEMKCRGVDMIKKEINEFVECGGLDPSFL